MDKLKYLKQIRNQTIQFRDTLGLSNNVSFGCEIEYENISLEKVNKVLENLKQENSDFKDWRNFYDHSNWTWYKGELINGEVSSGILFDTKNCWENLNILLSKLKELNGYVTKRCGTHINIGTQILESNQLYWQNFLLLWKLYNDEIYRFSSGEFRSLRKYYGIKPVSKELTIDDILKFEMRFDGKNEGKEICLFDKVHDVSLKKCASPNFGINNVIELRIPNGTLDICIIQNYINFYIKFLLACKQELDIDEIIYMINNKIHDIFQLSEFVFKDNELDKNNFLIQALKINKNYRKRMEEHIYSK